MPITAPMTTPRSAALILEPFLFVRSRVSAVEWVADDRASHAVTAAAAAAEFGTDDGDDFHACLAQDRVGVGISVVGDNHAGLDRDQIVSAVPLLALAVITRAARAEHTELGQAECGSHDF